MKTAAQTLEKPPFYWQARKYCEDHALPTDALPGVLHGIATREFSQLAKPWIDAKVILFNLSLQPPPPESYAQIDEVISMIARQCGLQIQETT